MTALFAETALLPTGWAADVRFEVGPGGDLAAVTAGADPAGAERLAGPVLPGMPNLHSHAFQRAMAGLGERASGGSDDFWSWRRVMYGFVERLTPEMVQAIAAGLYLDMVRAGYTAVGEFHYLHHQPGGRPYDDPAELSLRVAAAAADVGIGLTHLPVLYAHGGFGGQPLGDAQQRFRHDVDGLLRLVQALRRRHAGDPQVAVGAAPHSLRAVTPDELAALVAGLPPDAPLHIHVAEQTREVEDCLAWSGRRPVEHLFDTGLVDRRWCLVHATHVDAGETAAIAASGAVAGLCLTTEANLGDGLFPIRRFLDAGGRFGVGSDSHITVDPAEELRLLEYGQRLTQRRRTLLATDAPSVGASLWRAALAGGAAALGRCTGALAPGHRADLLVLDPEHPMLWNKSGDDLLDSLVFAGDGRMIRDVMIGGQTVIAAGRHPRETAIRAAWRAALQQLLA